MKEEEKKIYENIIESQKEDIAKLQQEIKNLQSSLYLSPKYLKAGRLGMRILRMPKKAIYKAFPEGTKRRDNLKQTFNIMKHPVHFKELQSIKERDKELDILYMRYGKLDFKQEEKPLVSIIIPVYNQIEFTYRCLWSIIQNTKDVSYEVIIADDNSKDGTKVLGNYINNITIVRNKENFRFLRNCNNAAKQARGKYVLFLNNDTEVTKNWLSSLTSLIEKDKTIGMVGSKLVYPNGMLQEAGGIIYNDGCACNYGKFDNPGNPEYNYVRDVDYISGASILLSKKLWDEIGGFDELFAPAYCEDSDLAFAVRNKGLRVVYQPASVVIHYEGISNGTDTTVGMKHYQIENTQKLKEKWQKEISKLPSRELKRNNILFRDRINNHKVVLVIDHMVPTFDKDAGSKTTYQYLKMLVNKGYIIKFVPDNFHNEEPYTSILGQLGIEVLYGINYKDNIYNWILENKDNIDIAYLNRPQITEKYIDYIKDNTDIKIIYYGHDLHYLREQREAELNNDEDKLKQSSKTKALEYSIMKKSDVVYYPSIVEENIIKKEDKNINVKAIHAYIFDNVDTSSEFNPEEREGMMFVGGFNHTPNRDAVKWFVEKIYPIIEEEATIPVYIVGSNMPREIEHMGNSNINMLGFLSEEELNNLYSKTKLVIVPLRYGAGIKGKVVEAMANGMPMVSTSVGTEGIEGAEKILYVSDDEEGFAKNVIKLYNNNEELKKMSINSRKYIDNNFSTEAAWKVIEKDFDNTKGGN